MPLLHRSITFDSPTFLTRLERPICRESSGRQMAQYRARVTMTTSHDTVVMETFAAAQATRSTFEKHQEPWQLKTT